MADDLVQQIAEVLGHHFMSDCYDGDSMPYYNCQCGADFDGLDAFNLHQAEVVADRLNLHEEWGATCDQWNGGRHVRRTREEAWDDAVSATEKDRGPYSMLEPPPPAMDDMRLERRWVSGWTSEQQ